MPRHVPDDFSFLPTVDSTDEEIMEREELRQAGKEAAAPEPPVEESHDPAWSDPAQHGDPAQAPASHLEPAAFEEPHTQDLPPEQQDGQALWQEFIQQGQPHAPAGPEPEQPAKTEQREAEKPLPVPKAQEALNLRVERESHPASSDTPPVSLGGRVKGEKKAKDQPKLEDTAAPPDPSSKPFIAPKPPPEEPLHPDQERRVRWRKLMEKAGFRSLGWSLAAHLALLLAGAAIGINQVIDRQVDFLPGGGSAQSQAAAAELTHKMQQKKNPWLKAKPRLQKVTVQTLAADIVLPEMPMDTLDLSAITDRMDIKAANLGGGAPLGMGTAGAGGGLGAGIGRGGKFSFVGQTAIGKRVVFVVDVSGSMSAVGSGESISRFDLLKKELVKSINQMPMNTQYQILFFSDFAWPHDQVDSRDVNALTKYRWEVDPKNYKNVKLPTFRFIQATPFSLRETTDIIQRSDNPGGTNWGSGLLMALNASPKPDVIFFMTDGLRSDEQGWVDVITAENKRRLPMTAIYTSAMQQPDAAKELDDLARRNNGRFTVVLGDGKIVKGEDFFKMR